MTIQQVNPFLVRLGDAAPAQYLRMVHLRGKVVRGSKGAEIGEVRDFYINLLDYSPQYLQVELYGMPPGNMITLVPVVIIAHVTDDAIDLLEPRDRIMTGPKLCRDAARQRFLFLEDP